MSGGINLTAIFIADLMGVILTSVMLIGTSWRFQSHTKENRALLNLILSVLISCVADSLSFFFDGRPGAASRIAVIASNTWLYSMNMITGLCWITFLSEHLHIRIGAFHQAILTGLCAVCAVMLFINLFIPFVFTVDEQNVYSRTSFYLLYLGLDFSFMLDGTVLYFLAKRKGGVLKFFPVFLFVIPVLIGMTVQTLFYGVSVIWPFISVSVAGIMIGLQNELVFRDTLTGLYNRFYLDYLKRMSRRKDQAVFTAMMLDLDGFKSINDRYGHNAGDEALIEAARIMNGAVSTLGTVIRYAGDEFVILLNTQESEQIDQCCADIRRGMEVYNRITTKDFRLSTSIGICPLDMKNDSISEFLNIVDRRMYEDKRTSVPHPDN